MSEIKVEQYVEGFEHEESKETYPAGKKDTVKLAYVVSYTPNGVRNVYEQRKKNVTVVAKIDGIDHTITKVIGEFGQKVYAFDIAYAGSDRTNVSVEIRYKTNGEEYEIVGKTVAINWLDNDKDAVKSVGNVSYLSYDYEGTGNVDESDFLVTSAQLEQFFGETDHFQAKTVDSAMTQDLNRVLRKYGIDTPEEIQMFMATVAHESKTSLTEIGVGDIYVRDGVDYRGAGYTQLTGKANYKAFADQMLKDGLIILDSNGNNPITTAGGGSDYIKENFAWESAGWHWTAPGNNMNRRIENGADFYKVSQVINGGPSYTGKPNGWNDRQDAYRIAQQIFK